MPNNYTKKPYTNTKKPAQKAAPEQPPENNNKSQEKQLTIHDHLKKIKNRVGALLPKQMDGAQMLMLAYDEFRLNKDLPLCNIESFLGAIMQAAKLGLYVSSALGKAYLVPFNNKKNGSKECKLIIGYRGMIELASRAPKIKKIEAHCFRKHDYFTAEYGTNEHLSYKKFPFGTKTFEENKDGDKIEIINPGDIIGAFAMATFDDNIRQFEVMRRAEIDDIMKKSPSSHRTDMPWKTNYPEMARKTPLRKLFKFLPYSTQIMQEAVTVDELAEVGKQDLAKVYEIEMDNDGLFLPNPQTIANTQSNQTSQIDNLKEALKKNGMGVQNEIPVEVQT
jgi:recombination protein RecT